MKVAFYVDTEDNLAAREKDLRLAIAMILGSTFTLARVSGQFTDQEIKEGDALAAPLVPAGVPLPSAATHASATLPTASLPTASSSPASVGSADLDITGIPHDVRIHAKPASGNAPTKNADGRWKKKKGIDEATFAAVTAELLRVVGGAPAATATPLPAATATPLPTVQADQPPATLPQLPPVLPVVADKPIEVIDFPSFAEWAAQQQVAHGEKFEGLLNQILAHYGLVDAAGAPQLPLLAHKAAAEPGVIKTFHNWLRVQL